MIFGRKGLRGTIQEIEQMNWGEGKRIQYLWRGRKSETYKGATRERHKRQIENWSKNVRKE